ncbi:MAG: hypothetical protein PHH11_13980 [Methylomonas sp.]|nr:hypothetical protein [Methylomonas sp.]
MINTKLATAIAGIVLSSAATDILAATTMYNTFTTTISSATDGWTRIADTNGDGYGTGPESKGNSGLILPWAGTAGNKLPFAYAGSSHLNWAVQLDSVGDVAEISGADSLAKYGFDAEIDTGGGAWNDNGLTAAGLPSATGPTGWRHQTDIGLISSSETQNVTINLSTVHGLFSRFGVTVFEGMDTNTANYTHHGAWNNASYPFTNDNPFGTAGLTNIGYSDNVDADNGFTFLAEAGKIYSVYLGGVGFSRWNAGVDGYKLSVSTSPVPVPGALWLFGSAIAGFVGLGRRKAVVSA